MIFVVNQQGRAFASFIRAVSTTVLSAGWIYAFSSQGNYQLGAISNPELFFELISAFPDLFTDGSMRSYSETGTWMKRFRRLQTTVFLRLAVAPWQNGG